MNKNTEKINQRLCYDRIWSWSPMLCEKQGPRASVTTKTSAFGLGFCLLSPSGHVFHTAWETMIKSYNVPGEFIAQCQRDWLQCIKVFCRKLTERWHSLVMGCLSLVQINLPITWSPIMWYYTCNNNKCRMKLRLWTNKEPYTAHPLNIFSYTTGREYRRE